MIGRRIEIAAVTVSLGGIALLGGTRSRARQTPSDAAKVHIRELEQKLPLGSPMRSALAAGARGDGVHQPWMDDMRKEGVKRAWIVIFTGGNDPRKEWRVEEAVYHSAYDRENSQITDPKWLERIRTSGLEKELNQVALDRTTRSPWHEHESTLVPIDLLDDEWLPSVHYEQAQNHIRRIVATLPPGSDLRQDFDVGDRGDGTRYAWMDKMRKEGVRQVEIDIDIEFHEDGEPRQLKVAHVRYYTEYDRPKSQIQDPERLERIRSNGLEKELDKVALQRAEKGAWLDVPNPRPNPFVGGATVVLVDDGWLPEAPYPMFTTHRPE